MTQLRLRMVAGPNGSGKSTLIEYLRPRYPLGYVLNPDTVELTLKSTGLFDFTTVAFTTTESEIREFFQHHPLGGRTIAEQIKINEHLMMLPRRMVRGYVAAVLCDFVRRKWVEHRVTFTFETVMSSPDKVRLLQNARAAGFRTYLYFVCTDDPLINVGRVALRVRAGGHTVPKEKITSRYRRSLSLLPSAIEQSDRAFLLDNTGTKLRLVAEFENQRLASKYDDVPTWAMPALPH